MPQPRHRSSSSTTAPRRRQTVRPRGDHFRHAASQRISTVRDAAPTARHRNSNNHRRSQAFSTAASHEHAMRSPRVFDLFFDLPHPAASSDSERARMVEPPEATNSAVLAEMYEPSAISRLARFAFPEHDDHKHALELQAKMKAQSRKKPSRRRSSNSSLVSNTEDLNKLDVYLLGFKSERHTFSVLLQDGETRLYGHTLRYLPCHRNSKARADTGRRGVRAIVILTRATGGDQFYTALLRTIEAAMMQGGAMAMLGDMEDVARERAMKLLHALYRRHQKKQSEVMLKLRQREASGATKEFDDMFMTVTSLEYDLRGGGYLKDRTLPGDFVKFYTPASLQAGFLPGTNPDEVDVPIMPLLRCLGPENTMRLLSALLCEIRIILVSADIVRVAACVRGAASLLAQGNLAWRHNLVPVLPPHLLSCLAEPTPYLVGLLDQFMGHVELLQSLKDVLCIHLDKNQIKTFGMAHPGQRIPDLLAVRKAKENVASILFNDMEQIMKAEDRIWAEEKKEEKIGKEVVSELAKEVAPRRKKGKGKGEAKIETDIAALFTRVMRGEKLEADNSSIPDESLQNPDANELARLDTQSGHVPRNNKSSNSHDATSLETFDVCENERGEEGLRASLTSFFLVTHGDLAMLLAQDGQGSFLLDRKKYLLAKKKAGVKEKSPLFTLYKAFSGTSLLENHLSQRIEEFQRGRSLLMPRHRTLFALCEKLLRVKKIEFTSQNVRKVVSKTIVHSPLHGQVERSELGRARALMLTSSQPYDGNVSQALSSLMQDCHQCDSALPQAMAVIWSRLEDLKPSAWKHPLLGLHLLKNLLLHGPLCALAFAMDGVDKIRKLRFYSAAKAEEHNREVRDSAKYVWELMMDRPLLLLRRQQVVSSRARLTDAMQSTRWDSYLIKKVPFTTDFKKYHTLLRPKARSVPCFMRDGKKGSSREDRQAAEELEIMRMKVKPRADGEPKIQMRSRSPQSSPMNGPVRAPRGQSPPRIPGAPSNATKNPRPAGDGTHKPRNGVHPEPRRSQQRGSMQQKPIQRQSNGTDRRISSIGVPSHTNGSSSARRQSQMTNGTTRDPLVASTHTNASSLSRPSMHASRHSQMSNGTTRDALLTSTHTNASSLSRHASSRHSQMTNGTRDSLIASSHTALSRPSLHASSRHSQMTNGTRDSLVASSSHTNGSYPPSKPLRHNGTRESMLNKAGSGRQLNGVPSRDSLLLKAGSGRRLNGSISPDNNSRERKSGRPRSDGLRSSGHDKQRPRPSSRTNGESRPSRPRPSSVPSR